MKIKLLFIALLVCGFSLGQTAVYTVTSTSAVTTTGTTPSGSLATYSQTYSTAKQITSGKSATLTLSNYAGYKITSIVLEMKSNASSGAGTLSVIAGSTSISTVSPTANFNTASWYGAWSGSYVNVNKTPTAYDIVTGENVVINIEATLNSLYIQKYTINYTPTPTAITSAQTGNWSSTSTWVGGVVPTSAANAIIANGHVVTMDSNTYNTRNSGTTTIVDVGGTLATNVQYINSGSTEINGAFQLNAGGYTNSGNNFVYGATGTLNFNNTSSYGVNNTDQYWPTTSGPFNVTVLQGGMTLNSGANRVVNGLFQTAASVALTSASLTLNGTCQINALGYFLNAPIYGSSSLLKYNMGGNYGRGFEWTTTGTIGSTPGYPNDVQITNNTTLDYPNTGAGVFSSNLGLNRDLTIDAMSSLYMDYGGNNNKSGSLTVGRDILLSGNLSLGNAINGDLFLKGNWTRTGTFTPNSRTVNFTGTTAQTLTGVTTFDYLTMNGVGGLFLNNNITVNQNLVFTSGKITIGANNLTVGTTGSITGFNNSKYVVTNGTGKLIKQGVGNVATVFPIGFTATNYTPVTLTNTTGTSNLSVGVKQSITNAVSDPSKIVTLEWGIVSSAATITDISPTWANAIPINKAASFTNTGTGELGNYITSYTTYPVTLNTTTTTATGVALQNGANLIVVGNTASLNSPFFVITGTTAHGSTCPNTAATSQTYTITNSGRVNAVGVTVVSNDPQFVISALSATTIAANGGTATYTVTFTPTTAGAKTATITVASSTSGSNSPISDLTGTGATSIPAVVVTNTATLPTSASINLRATSSTFSTCPSTMQKGFVYAVNSVNNDPINAGTGVTTTIVTLGSAGGFNQVVTGLVSGTTYSYKAYLYDGTTYTYGSVQTFQTKVDTPVNVTNAGSCLTDDSGTISWTALSTAPTGYMVFAVAGTTAGTGNPTLSNADYGIVNSNYNSATSYAALGKLLYKGTANSIAITGLTEGTVYSFRVFSYNEGGEIRDFSSGTIAGSKVENVAAQDDVKTFTGTPVNKQVTLNWTYNLPTSCFDEVMIVANQGAVVFTPSGDGSAYTFNTVYSSPNQIVFKGTGTSRTITGLTNGTEYCFKIFVRRGTSWSDGISICATPDVIYCSSSGGNNNSMINNVIFNTINQTSSSTAGYSDYTAVTTNVMLGDNYDLSVKVNTNGNYTSYVKAWIDWNKDGTFDSTEAYELGTVTNNTNGTPLASPFTITVPTNAIIGNVRMRIAANTDNIVNGYSTPCQSFTYGEVEDYTITISQPLNAEINVRGGVASISIPNGFDDPNGLNGTQFLTTPLNVDSAVKTFTIENLGIANLNLAGPLTIKLEGNNPSDFIVTQQATTPVVNGAPVTFKIKFHPTVAGLRTAIVRIESNDSDENPYLFAIEGTGNCTIAPSITVFPINGPRNTLVAFSSATSNLTGATVTYNNVAVPIVLNTTNKIEVLVPNDANDGYFEILLATGCSKTQAFDVIDSDLTSCQASGVAVTDATDLIIYELYDEKVGSGGVITLYNRTGATVDLSGYSIKRAGDYGGTYTTTALLFGTVANGAVAVIGVTSASCGYAPTGNGSFGVTGFNANDGFRLMKGTTKIDDVRAPNYVGYYLKRKNTNLNPNTTYNASEWTNQTLGKDECLTDVTTAPIVKIPPTVTLQPSYLVNCGITSTTLSVAGSEGVSGGSSLAYQWYVLGTSGNWTAVVNTGVYSGATTTTLTISNITGLDDYQYYCQIRESSATCYTATNAALIRIPKKTWNGTTWSGDGLPPTSSEKAIVDGNLTIPYTIGATTYNTLEACECQVNLNKKLIAGNINGTTPATLVIQGAVNNYGEITIHNNSSLVQVNDVAINTGDISVNRIAQVKRYDYVYWSSPVADFPINSIPDSHRYEWDTTIPNPKLTQGNWVDPTTTNMDKGKGYIVRSSIGDATLRDLPVTFTGIPFNGKFNFPIMRGSILGSYNDNYNLVGNPYPSAIDADDFLYENANPVGPNPVLEGAVHIWSHGNLLSTIPNPGDNPFYQNFTYNYNPNDYIVYNLVGPGSGPETFLGKIASGQGFFVKMNDGPANATQSIIFKNSMRSKDHKNNNFYKNRNPNDVDNESEKSRIWLDLFKFDGGSSRTLIGYVKGATYDKDVMYDAFIEPEDMTVYTLTGDNKLVIQGRPLPFDIIDKVPLGINILKAGKYVIAIGVVDGLFSDSNQNIYLEDKSLNLIHNLKKSPYEFTSEKGMFNDRFILRYTDNALSTEGFINANQVIVSTNHSQITITSKAEAFNHVQIFDLLGRKIYDKKDMNSNVYNITDLVQDQVLIVKVKLNNGSEISNKIIVK